MRNGVSWKREVRKNKERRINAEFAKGIKDPENRVHLEHAGHQIHRALRSIDTPILDRLGISRTSPNRFPGRSKQSLSKYRSRDCLSRTEARPKDYETSRGASKRSLHLRSSLMADTSVVPERWKKIFLRN